jgi:hypothetical protein
MLSGCSAEPWEAYVIPDRSKPHQQIALGDFDDLERCRDAALSRLEEMNGLIEGDYWCGRRCRDDDQHGLRVCAEATR